MHKPPDFLQNPAYSVLSRFGAPGWAVVLAHLAQVNREREPRDWVQRVTAPTRFRLAATLEALAQNDEDILLSLLPGQESAEYLRVARGAYSPRDTRTYGPVRHVDPSTMSVRGALPPDQPNTDDLRAMVAAGGHLVAIDVHVPVTSLQLIASDLGWRRGQGKAPIERLNPMWYDDPAPYEFDDAPGAAHWDDVQALASEGWALLMIPVGTPISVVQSYLKALHREIGIGSQRSASPTVKGAPGRPRLNQTPRLIVPLTRVTQEAATMDLSRRTFTAWSTNRIVPLFDLLAWKRSEHKTVKDEELASWLWPQAQEDPKAKLDHVRRQLATALAVADRLRAHSLSTLPHLQKQTATVKLPPFFTEPS